METTTFIAFITKGLRDICISELSQLPGYQQIEITDKHVVFSSEFHSAKFSELRTIDDIAILCDNTDLEESITNAIAQIKTFRKLDSTYGITISSFKSSEEIKKELQKRVLRIMNEDLKLNFVEKKHSNIDIRIVLENNEYKIAVKLFPDSLYVRPYGHITALGALRPTIASIMVKYLKDKVGGKTLLDPFCGTGTFLCEGAAHGYEPKGSDIDSEKVQIANKNCSKNGLTNCVIVADATEISHPEHSADIIVMNLPWGKQVAKQVSFKKVIENVHRTLSKNGAIGIITTDVQLIKKELRKQFGSSFTIEQRQIGYIGQSPWIIFGHY